MEATLERIGYNRVWTDPEFSMLARRRAEELGTHELSMVSELSGADSSAVAQPSPAPTGGSDPEDLWGDEEDEEVNVLTRLLTEGLPAEQDEFFGNAD